MITKKDLDKNFELYTGKTANAFHEFLNEHRITISNILTAKNRMRIASCNEYGHAFIKYFEGNEQALAQEISGTKKMIDEYRNSRIACRGENYEIFKNSENALLMCIVSGNDFSAYFEHYDMNLIESFIHIFDV